MTETPTVETLADRRQVTVLLRLVLDRQGELVYGQVVDVRGVTQGRFIEWRLLTRLVRGCLASEEQEDPQSSNT